MQQKLGKWSLRFTEAPFILESSSVVGTKEADGPLGGLFDYCRKDDRLGRTRGKRQRAPCSEMHSQWPLEKHIWMRPTWTMYLQEICSDSLWPQHFGVENFRIPWFGVYGACSTCGESLSLAAAFVAAGYAKHAVAVTSSHFGSAEKQFRFPNQYANQRPVSATWTVTGVQHLLWVVEQW